jgi:outer membrane translocation and assembly module TamA
LSATIFIGPKYYWHSLGVQNIPEEYLSKAGYRIKDFLDRETNPRQFERLVNRLLKQATNAGYPFASFQLSEIDLQKNSLKAILDYSPGPQIRYDTLTIQPSDLVREKFMAAHLNVKRGELFSYDKVSTLETSIQQLSFVRLKEPVELQFANNLCNISFGLEKRKTNRFDAIIGFLPNQGADNGLRITGYADLHLENLFHSGKALTFQWQQFQALSQTLRLNYNHPNLLRSPIGIDFEANLIRQDTTFLNTNLAFDIFYARNKVELAFLTNIISSRQLSNPVDTTSLPSVAAYNMNLFGVDFKYSDIDYQPNPRSGFSLEAGIKFGNKKININPNLPESIYDSLKINSGQLQVNLASEVNYGIGRLFSLNANLQAGAIWNNDRLFVNDLLRLGGVNSLRGFNELELFVSGYGLMRLEWRLLMSEASRLFIFYDQAFTVNSIIMNTDSPLGFGAGINLRTGGGDLQLIYALGVSQEQSLSLDQSKIHLGYVATF